jgi:Spy/CpxP family protein refolding chaperone
MKKIVIIGVSLILGLGLVAVAVMAQGPGFGRGFGMGPGYGPPGNFLANLTPEQSAKMQSLQQAHLQAIAPLQQELLAKGTEMRNLSLNPDADPAMIGAKQKELWDLRSKLQEMTNNLRLQIREILTPEQQAQFDSFGPRRGMGPRMGRGPGPGFGPGSFGPGGGFGPGFGPTGNQ